MRIFIISGPMARRLRFAAVASAFLAMVLSFAPPAHAQGWWWGTPINPGFDRNAVIQVTGTANQIDIVSWGRPSTLRLETAAETFTVVLGPGWYLAELRVDLRSRDTLQVEGSKMKSRQGQLYLVAARILNQRTGALIDLRDELGRPRWKDGPPPRE